METYNSRFANLTNSQREAVQHIQGPLLVIAGPGTGKTELLSMRVAEILKKTDSNPSNILCLTFTNKAAANMRNRLQQLIGAESLQVNVKTFHSLSAELMGEYPEYFWNGARLSTAPDAVQTDIIENILTRLPLDNPLALKFAGNYTSISRIQEALKLTKEAGLTPEKLRAIIEVNLAYIDSIEAQLVDAIPDRLSYKILEDLSNKIDQLPNQNIDKSVAPLISLSTYIKDSLADAVDKDANTNKTKHTGEWKKQLIQNENKVKAMHKQRKANNWWLNLSDIYTMYRDELHNRGFYDYSDMIIEVIYQLERQASMLSDVQERYQYIMIDEFQDSNAAQMRLAHLLSSHPLDEGNPNLMAVGDDDQSIYKFNGAELNNMLNFKRMYPGTKTIVLEDNFRSSQAILDTSKQIIELAEDRLVKREPGISKNLVARNEPKEIGKITHKSYPSRNHQLYDIAKLIKDDDRDRSIAVLARKHESLQIIAAQLNSIGVPINYEKQNNILEHDSIKQIISICRIIKGINEGEEQAVNKNIADTLSHPMWGVESRILWKLAIENRYNPHWLDSLIDNENSELKAIGDWFLWLSKQAKQKQLEIIMDYIIGLRHNDEFTSPFKNFYIDIRPAKIEYIEALSAIQKLRSTINELSADKDIDVTRFVDFVEIHEENNIIIADESVFVTSKDAVQLLTVHKAKGLEFDDIYIVDAVEKEWQAKNKGSNTPINLPLQPYGDDMDDYIRLMYVATTRAKQNITVTSYRLDGSSQEVVSTPIVSPIVNIEQIEQERFVDPVEILESNIRWPKIDIEDAHNLLSPVLQNFSLNVTSLMNFLDLTKGGPEYFLERNLLRLPSAKTTSLAFGTAIHSALEIAQRQVNVGEFDIDKIKNQFQSELHKESILPEEIERWIPHGLKLIDRLFNEQLVILPEGATPEQRLQNINIGDALIDGKLDHVISDEHAVLITDYKTGAPLRSLDSKDKSIQVKLWKHKTQLIFYALIAKNHPLYSSKEITCQMQYLEADNPKDFSKQYLPSEVEIERLADLSRAVFKKVKNFELPDISKYPADIDGIKRFEDDLISGSI